MHDGAEPLTGGNVSGAVVRIGDTVRRPVGEWTPAVHALLAHLHEVGYRAAPRPRVSTTPAARYWSSCPGGRPGDSAATGTQPWARLAATGHAEVWRADSEFIRHRHATWLHALLD